MTDKWDSVSIDVPGEAAEAVEFALDSGGAIGTATSFLREGEAADRITITGYFDTTPDLSDLDSRISDAMSIYGLHRALAGPLTHSQVENEDWLAEWKKGWQPTRSGRFVVAPAWAETDASDDAIVIRIDPNMAFGTGTHETTRLCLEMIGDLYRPGLSFLDVGTGTGILAIAAAKIDGGDAQISACDNDPEAVRIARENAAMNGAEGIVFWDGAFKFEGSQFDIVCANLTLDVILPALDDLIRASKQNLILSGILTEQENAIREALDRRGKTQFEVRRMNEWIAVALDVQGFGV